MIGELKDLKGYVALHYFKSISASIEVEIGDLITVEQYELLSFDEQELFKPDYNPK